MTRIRYRLTRLGVHFVFVAAFTMIGGALRGFNLLLVLAGLLLGALIVQWRCSRFFVQSTTVKRFRPIGVFAGTPFHVRHQVRNLSRLLPLWMIRIDDEIDFANDQEPTLLSSGIGVVGPSQRVTQSCDCLISDRGCYRTGPITVGTLFPFCLLHARITMDAYDEVHVFPSLLRLQKGWQQTLMTRQGGVAAAARRTGPNEGDFFGLREWQMGDNPRWIHHRTTARVGEPIVRQFEQRRQFDACLLVDCFEADVRPATSVSGVETALSFAATILTSMDRAPTNRLVLAVAGATSVAVCSGRVRNSQHRMLEILAEAIPDSRVDLAHAIETSLQNAGAAKDMVVISTRDMQAALSAEGGTELAALLQRWQRRGGLKWINVQSPEFARWIIGRTPPRPTSRPMERDDAQVA